EGLCATARVLLSAACPEASTTPWSGDSAQAGPARPASPVSGKAWQRQPPQSISRRSQLRQGSAIQSVPRNRLKASDRYQMSARLLVRTEGKAMPGSVSAAWQGTAVPDGGGRG